MALRLRPTASGLARRNGAVSFWLADTGIPARRPPLEGSRHADVCIVGGGFTGLWTAFYLKQAHPELDVVVLEQEFAGFGASGRNGGHLLAAFAGPREDIAATHGREGVLALQRAMQGAVEEVIAVSRAHGIEADIHRGGDLAIARSPAQLARLRASVEADRGWGLTEDDVVLLSQAETEARVRMAGGLGGVWNAHAARVHPAKLVLGLARLVERLGVRIYENTRVLDVAAGVARTDRGDVHAPRVLCCLEGFTPSLASQHRRVLPLNSAMIVTDPLPAERWSEIGWSGREVVGDFAHAYIYAQRTEDGRIAFGGRGVPYRFGSRTDTWGMTQAATVRQLVDALHTMFPQTAAVEIDHAWCGVLGVPRDWRPSITFDRATGVAFAGGYVGTGVAATNLVGRILADLATDTTSELTQLAWVDHHARRWEPEPLRLIGSRLIYGLYRSADRRESASGESGDHPLARLADAISGR